MPVRGCGQRGPNLVVLGLPRGGVPVGFEVATALDVIVVRKLGLPYQPELAMGAIGEGGVRVLNTAVVRAAHVTAQELGAVEYAERGELERRAARFRAGGRRLSLRGKTALIARAREEGDCWPQWTIRRHGTRTSKCSRNPYHCKGI
ncbi:MAG: hypothetical protein GEV00_17655 [Actinophytocola sp.]|nr:hypothetical protein [Actinophytocola sp.]